MQLTPKILHPLLAAFQTCNLKRRSMPDDYYRRAVCSPEVVLSKGVSYYLHFRTFATNNGESMRWVLTFFDEWGVFIFQEIGLFYCGLWHWRRQGHKRMGERVQSAIRCCCKRHGVHLNEIEPYEPVSFEIYKPNIIFGISRCQKI